MATIADMRRLLTNMSCDDWEQVDYDTRENLYGAAWDFWCANAPASEIGDAYEEIKKISDLAVREEDCVE